MSKAVAVQTLLGDYPVTQALKKGEVKSPSVSLDFADVKTVSAAFKRVVRNLEFDCSELAIVTFLMAKAHGKPLVLLPAVVLARFQHPHIVYNVERGLLAPADLAGRRDRRAQAARAPRCRRCGDAGSARGPRRAGARAACRGPSP